VIVVTGSNGKTTLLHLVESQLQDRAMYSHEANSSFGIPFNILGLHRKDLTLFEWPKLFLLAPFMTFKKPPKEKIYIVEADCDRPHEGEFLGNFLKPEVTLWLNVSRTHGMNFEKVAVRRKVNLEEIIAEEFGNFAKQTKNLVIANRDDVYIEKFLKTRRVKHESVSLKNQRFDYKVDLNGTSFMIGKQEYKFKHLLPRDTFYQIAECKKLMDYLGFKFDKKFVRFKLPPGRSSVFRGIKGVTIVDSAYNANLASMTAVIDMFAQIKAKDKWVVIGDMLEQGRQEQEEHEKLSKVIVSYSFQKIILMGPRVSKYTSPLISGNVVSFLTPKEVLDYLKANIQGGEMILFKGARFLEGIIENLLLNKDDAKFLDRREKIWEIRRKKWGL
jgi:UDP-N-acetylmuramoyl-tripeptide--D-alanyl-D-alanine ligase